jgi:hypothetical protein
VSDLPDLFARLNQVLATADRIPPLDDRGTGAGAIVSGPVFERFTMAAIRVLAHVNPDIVRASIKGYFSAYVAASSTRVLYDVQKPELFALLLGLRSGHTITPAQIADDLSLTPANRKKAIARWPTTAYYADEIAPFLARTDNVTESTAD